MTCAGSPHSEWTEASLEPDRLELYITGRHQDGCIYGTAYLDVRVRHTLFEKDSMAYLFGLPYFSTVHTRYLRLNLFHPWETCAMPPTSGASDARLRAMAAASARRRNPEKDYLQPSSMSLPPDMLRRITHRRGNFGPARHVIGPPAIHVVRRPDQTPAEAMEEALHRYSLKRKKEVAREFPSGLPIAQPEQVERPSAEGSDKE
jgi:hypothetical protein